jgi:hypothetical protein
MRCGDAVKDALREALKKSGLSREVVADEMSRLLGENIGTNQKLGSPGEKGPTDSYGIHRCSFCCSR